MVVTNLPVNLFNDSGPSSITSESKVFDDPISPNQCDGGRPGQGTNGGRLADNEGS